ncbi:NAD(P)H-dependent glycerol-3-phosphate dehydrogenase [Streptococcus parauberis]|uniref:Glycerol-3-phosphate dehydrogenase [NAD(P)+] n=2 Tax=Streptococcus parauberis TaxID=1348 RepID=A0A0E2UQF1_9STRE|nr:NAD(P)H-dependent glycerol-3-phosphate dehydrogenase [Streptococcus parauberis]AEF26158.1 NAD(P)H-dependent glycerol-3-phosphate dehydrogenase [Streptococcus parauberis KCTC 11537]AUT04934.1 Glycerol-3-phosphate dehydrogenase (NAD(P)(+)) [Streptococcus parauberis]EMF48637.1 Glycerol-3-phosphate dehydrogenase [Streptococcus parauberis KRS-02109]EMG25023.1 Glycerol-3-phosphate dehydrogenase [Streptococcus parauberis KRS-02083]MDT2731078.1 NAD(P)H-dependent glycerol-3-phosphate dehydrogenase [
MNKQKVAILGPGSWGTALSQVLIDNGHQVILWGDSEQQITEINTEHTNTRYFNDIVLDERITATTNLKEALAEVDAILFVVPTKVTRLVAKQVAEVLDHKVTIMHASKGLEPGTHERLSTVISEEIPTELRSDIVVVSGPSHAEETIVRDITLITAASKDLDSAKYVQSLFSNRYFRLYTNSDVIGVETAGALKNIIAVGAGALHGLGYGDNAKAAVITRGLAEITRLGVKLGANPLTYSGLSGVGDLIVTGTSVHSRNWRAGDALGRGEKLEDIERNMGMVIEGISTTKVAYEIAQELGVYMPITSAIYRVIYEGAEVKASILEMMSNEFRSENEWH